MGCCNSKKDKLKNGNKNKSKRVEEINIESQEKELINILAEVNKEIDDLKNQVIDIFLFNIFNNNKFRHWQMKFILVVSKMKINYWNLKKDVVIYLNCKYS